MSNSPYEAHTPVRSGRPATAAIGVAIVAMALKLPQALLALAFGDGGPAWIPSGSVSTNGVFLSLAWMVFGAVLLWLRRWIGVISSLWFCIVSGISGTQLIPAGYQLWGWWQVLTAAIAVIAVIAAVVLGAFKGSRW